MHEGLRQRLGNWLLDRRDATVREVLLLARKLQHAEYVIRPERYFVHRRLWLANPHLIGEERRGGWGRVGKALEESGGGEEIRTNAGVHGRRGLVEIVHEPE